MSIYILIVGLIGIACWLLVGIKVASRLFAREFRKEIKNER